MNNHLGSEFSLTDENNLEITNETHAGEVHLITFLFTNCTSLCPTVTSNIKQAVSKSQETIETPVLIISVDPELDTTDARTDFKHRWKLPKNWSYLNGSKEDLQKLWKAFYVSPQESAIKSLSGQFTGKYDVVHTSPVFIINKTGIPVVVHTNPIKPELLHEDIVLVTGK